ncbi:MAG: fasciclin domain-containing protein [Nitriliruptoraceae bacterium]|nr:fasciclin domain-containing protein [Nitriliruptoraceae bacterium]
MKRSFIAAMAALLLVGMLAAPAVARGGPPAGVVPGDDSITDIVIASASAGEEAEFTLLLDAVLYIAGTNPDSALVAGLFDSDQYTVFAPTDAAFGALVGALSADLDADILAAEGPFAAIDDLLGPGTIEAVVSYHVTDGRRASNSVVPRQNTRTISTLLDGATFSVDTQGGITASENSATIIDANISASNGVVHVIDTVLLP